LAANLAQLTYPTDVAVDSAGNVYIDDYGNFEIRQVTTDGIIHSYAGTAVDGYSGDGQPATSGLSTNPVELFQPYGIALDSTGNLYIMQQGDGRIRKVLPGSAGAARRPGLK
jgi:DNA-binding beta-propeller fold protein YncE